VSEIDKAYYCAGNFEPVFCNVIRHNCYNKLKPYTCVYQEVYGRLGCKSRLKFIC
jgi:hypothetical protein